MILENKESLEKLSQSATPFTPLDWCQNNYCLLAQHISELSIILQSFQKFPQMLKNVSDDLSIKLSTMCANYECLIADLKNKCKNIEAITKTIQCLKEGENQKLSKLIQQKQQIIQILTKKINKLQSTIFINSSCELGKSQSHQQQASVIHLQKASTNSSKLQISNYTRLSDSLCPENPFRDRYFRYKQQNDVLKTKLNKLSKTEMVTPHDDSPCHTKRDLDKNIFNRTPKQTPNEKANIVNRINVNLKKHSKIDQKQNIGNPNMTKRGSEQKKQSVSELLNNFLSTLRSY